MGRWIGGVAVETEGYAGKRRELRTRPHYAEGADAGLAGLPDSANPYDPETQEDAHLSWNDGWASIHYHEDDE